jgi:hypothetical protein
VRSYVRRSVVGLGAAFDLGLISFAALYFEMIVIRWLASDVRVFAYLKNLPLLAAFLGLGLGCALATRGAASQLGDGAGNAASGASTRLRAEVPGRGLAAGALRYFPPLCLVFATLVAFAGPLGLVHVYFPQDDLWVWNDANWQAQAIPTVLLVARFFAVVLLLFFLVVALFASLGVRLGALFDMLPPTRAYSVNLVGSLAGIWVFAALAWLGWPPIGWFALGFLALLRFFAPDLRAWPAAFRRRRERLTRLVRPAMLPPRGGVDDLPSRSLRRSRAGERDRPTRARDAAGLAGSRVAPQASYAAVSANRSPYHARGAAERRGAEAAGATPRLASDPTRGARRRGLLGSAVAVALLGAALLVVAVAPGATRWSPYYRIDLSPYLVPSVEGRLDTAGHNLTVNHDYHQKALDLAESFVRAHPDPDLETARLAYDLPYRFARPSRVLVVGAGMGNDVAAALRAGAQRVDAVEIDPAILDLGRELHPERPYGSPRVRAINDDARAYLARTDEQYDLIVFGLLDSHTLLSSMSSLRLDSYVYTLESLEQARAHLAPGGHVALAFAASVGGWDWLAARLYQMVATAFDTDPIALTLGYDVSTLYVVGPGVRERVDDDPALAALEVDPTLLQAPVPPATDDWPFLYLRERGVPVMPYGVMLALLLAVGGGLVLLTLRGGDPDAPAPPTAPPASAGLDMPMFLLGAAFMLLETKSISQLALLFGSTWVVTALIVSAILLLALAANLFVGWWRPARVGPAYALLTTALLADYLLPLGALGGQSAIVRAALGTLLLALPLLFAGVIFATLFSRAAAPSHAFGSNLLGALAGGLLEYLSMATGFKALGLLALALYWASWLALRRRPLLARARQTRAWRGARASRVARL